MGKHLKFSLTAAILLAIGLTVALAAVFSTPAPKSDKPEDLAAFIASPGFRKLPDAKQEEYLKRMRPSRENRGNPRKIAASMTEAQRRAMFENIRALHEKKMIEELAHFKGFARANTGKDKPEKFTLFTNSEEGKELQNEVAQTFDVGFKVFKLDTSNLVKWDSTPTENKDEIYQRMSFADKIK